MSKRQDPVKPPPLSLSFLWLQLQRPDPLLRLVSVGFTRNTVRWLTTAGNPVLFRETSSPAGGFSLPTCRPTCRPFRSLSSRWVLQLCPPFPEGYSLRPWIPRWLRSLCLSVPGSQIFFWRRSLQQAGLWWHAVEPVLSLYISPVVPVPGFIAGIFSYHLSPFLFLEQTFWSTSTWWLKSRAAS